MRPKRRAPEPTRATGGATRPTPSTQRILSPIAGGISVALGVTLLIVAKFPGAVYLPLLLVSLGVGLMTSVLARTPARETVSVDPPVPSERFIADALVICPSCSARSFQVNPPPAPAPSAAWRVPEVRSETLAPPTAHGGSTDPAEFLWESWRSVSGRLPVELVGPVPETAYVRPRPGAPALHEEGEPILLEMSTGGGPPGVSLGATVVSVSVGALPPTPAPEMEDPETDGAIGMLSWKGIATSTLAFGSMDPVLQEALNPTPPHLRARPEPTPQAPPSRGRAVLPAGQCADCSEPVPDPANWRRCLDCEHVLCADCMVDALISRERPWCAYCAETRGFNAG
jgi:hypothetical protein